MNETNRKYNDSLEPRRPIPSHSSISPEPSPLPHLPLLPRSIPYSYFAGIRSKMLGASSIPSPTTLVSLTFLLTLSIISLTADLSRSSLDFMSDSVNASWGPYFLRKGQYYGSRKKMSSKPEKEERIERLERTSRKTIIFEALNKVKTDSNTSK